MNKSQFYNFIMADGPEQRVFREKPTFFIGIVAKASVQTEYLTKRLFNIVYHYFVFRR